MYPSSGSESSCVVEKAKNSTQKEEDLRTSDGSRTADVRKMKGAEE